jgi:hypothetical protein
MTQRSGGKAIPLILIAAGLAAIIGALLTWTDLSSAGISFANGSVSADPTGIEAMYGWVAVGGGAVLIVAGFVRLRSRARSVGALAILAAVAVGAACGYVAATVEERFVDVAVDTASNESFPPDQVRAEMDTLYIQNAIDVTPGAGLYVSGAGAVLGLIGGVAALMGGRSQPEVASDTTSPAGDFDVDERLGSVIHRPGAPADPIVRAAVKPEPASPTDHAAEPEGEHPSSPPSLGDNWSA